MAAAPLSSSAGRLCSVLLGRPVSPGAGSFRRPRPFAPHGGLGTAHRLHANDACLPGALGMDGGPGGSGFGSDNGPDGLSLALAVAGDGGVSTHGLVFVPILCWKSPSMGTRKRLVNRGCGTAHGGIGRRAVPADSATATAMGPAEMISEAFLHALRAQRTVISPPCEAPSPYRRWYCPGSWEAQRPLVRTVGWRRAGNG
jgi:hypothetical protein